ncbi:MAG: hypothetical protein A3J83_02495 [Elusimicrobia bacterium RIFOXYA2_FULL_40_6]|nr:MAG: hypothetical protein A3J83_02495 [Elusimicrobia bacterium RIFOXYA2_FULL_40_6]
MLSKFKNTILVFVLYSLPLAVLSGCVATSNEVTQLRDDIEELRSQISFMNKNQADLSLKMDEVGQNMGALKEKLDDNKIRMSTLSKRMDDIHSSLSQRMDILSQQLSGAAPTITTPSEQYKLSYGDYSKGKYDLAIVGFRSFIERYPDSELSSSAQYYLADSYYNKNDFAAALKEFSTMKQQYSASELVVSAEFKQGLCYLQLKKPADAKAVFEMIVKDHPQSPEAEQSKEKLKN